jgi:hypothetical protein
MHVMHACDRLSADASFLAENGASPIAREARE